MDGIWNEYKVRKNVEKTIEDIETKLSQDERKIIAFIEIGKRLMKERIFRHCSNLLEEVRI